MPSLTLILETVTPLLMNGANQTPEIRAASFRGVLRYWLRAVLGGIYQGDIGELKKEESRYFGSTEAGSPVRVRVEHGLEPATNRVKYVLPPTVRNKQGQQVPMRHAGYDESVSGNPQRLWLTLDTHPLCPAPTVFTPQLYAALLLAFHLGAFGKRSRRGGGVLRAIECDADFALDEQFASYIQFRAEDQASLVNFLDNDLVPFVSAAQGSVSHSWTAIPTYPIWAPDYVKVLVGPVGHDDDITADSGAPKPPFREGYRSALQEPWEVSGQKSLHRMKDAWGYAKGGRRASAVHMRVHLGADGLYYPLITMFRSSSIDGKGLVRNNKWGKLEDFDTELIKRGYRRLAFCTGAWS